MVTDRTARAVMTWRQQGQHLERLKAPPGAFMPMVSYAKSIRHLAKLNLCP
jgi:hypothetical protein